MNHRELSELGREMVKLAQENLIKDGELSPAVGIISPHKTEWKVIQFGNFAEKRDVYERVSERARKLQADAVICINDTKIKTVATEEDIERYRNGQLQKDPEAGDAIVVAVKRRFDQDVSPFFVCRYTLVEGKFIFDEVEELDAQVNLVPDWWD